MALVPLVPASHQLVVVQVTWFGTGPDTTAKGHVDHNDGRAPDIQSTGVIGFLLGENLGRDVGFTAADAGRAKSNVTHILTTLTAGFTQARVRTRKDFRYTKVGNLELAIRGDEQVLKLDVSMSDAIGVQVGNTLDKLLEEAESVLELALALEPAFLNKAEKVAFRAVLHDVVPAAMIVAESNGLDDVGVVETLGDTEFGLDLLVVLVSALAMRLATELLDGIQLSGAALASHERHLGRGSFAQMLTVAAKQLVLVLKLRQKLSNVDGEVIGKTQAHAASLGSSTSVRWERPREAFWRVVFLIGLSMVGLRNQRTVAVVEAARSAGSLLASIAADKVNGAATERQSGRGTILSAKVFGSRQRLANDGASCGRGHFEGRAGRIGRI